MGPAGLKGKLGLNPDLVSLGKYLGGGMPFGAFGGRADVMNVYDPRTPSSLSHSGTFQNNALMLNAGYVGVTELYAPAIAEVLNRTGDELRAGLNDAFQGTRMCVTGLGSILCIHATKTGLRPDQISCKDDVMAVEDIDLKRLFWLEMLEAGFWMQLRGSIALNIQLPKELMGNFVEAARDFRSRHEALLSLPN